MTRIFIFLLFSLTTGICSGQTQNDMNQEAKVYYQKFEKEINSVYQAILKKYSSDIAYIKNLKTAQRLWIQFRDAEMKMQFPDRPEGHYGSVQLMCRYNYMTELTKERIKTLNIWLTGIEEGDVCSGSVNTKN